jgi:hypothetical protein
MGSLNLRRSGKETGLMPSDSYIKVTPPVKVKAGQALKEPHGISSPFWKKAYSRPSFSN